MNKLTLDSTSTTVVFLTIRVFLFVISPFVLFNFFRGSPANASPRIVYDDKSHYPLLITKIRKESGFPIESVNPIPENLKLFEGVEGWTFKVDKQYMQLWIFDTSLSLESAFKGFSNFGYTYTDPKSLNKFKLQWQKRPTFYINDNNLIIYLGDDDDVESLLKKVVGPPILVEQDGKEFTK